MKKYYLEKNPTKIPWPMSANLIKKLFIQKEKNIKLPWLTSAKSDT